MAGVRSSRSDTRDRILDAAFDLFVAHGFDGTSISAVERRVGLAVGTGSLNHHFRSKDELLRAALEREIALRMTEVEQERATLVWPDDPDAQFAVAAQQVLTGLRRFDRLRRLLNAEGDRVPDLRKAITKQLAATGAIGDWVNEPARLITIAALAGYHMFEQLDDAIITTVSEHDFIAALIAALPTGRPPGVAEGELLPRPSPRPRTSRKR